MCVLAPQICAGVGVAGREQNSVWMKRRVRGRGSSFESFRRITTDRAGGKVRPRDKVKMDLLPVGGD